MYKKIVWRKLYTDRDDTFWDKLESFVEAVHHKKYKISIKKLLKKRSIVPTMISKDSGDKVVEEDRTFFWSELIAKAYKILGLLDTEKSSTKFYPKHFSSKANLELKGGVLGEELIIS